MWVVPPPPPVVVIFVFVLDLRTFHRVVGVELRRVVIQAARMAHLVKERPPLPRGHVHRVVDDDHVFDAVVESPGVAPTLLRAVVLRGTPVDVHPVPARHRALRPLDHVQRVPLHRQAIVVLLPVRGLNQPLPTGQLTRREKPFARVAMPHALQRRPTGLAGVLVVWNRQSRTDGRDRQQNGGGHRERRESEPPMGLMAHRPCRRRRTCRSMAHANAHEAWPCVRSTHPSHSQARPRPAS